MGAHSIILLVALLSVVLALPFPQVEQTTPRNIISLEPAIVEALKENLDDVCDKMKNSLFNPMRCVEDESELTMPGKLYNQLHPDITELDPIVLLPGIGGSALDAKLSKQDSPAWFCFKTWNWFRIWFATREIFAQTCWMDNLAVRYNETDRVYYNTYGVQTRPTDFGGLKGVDYLDYVLGLPVFFTGIYSTMVKSLEEVGYVKGKNLRGAPFDWRLPAEYLETTGWYKDFQALVEETYTSNGNKPVHIVSHSLGCPTALYFLNRASQAWRDQYVKSFIPIAGPWSGAGKALRAAVSGDNFGLSFAEIDIIPKQSMRNVAREAGGLVQLFPDSILWSNKSVFVSTPTKNYTANDYVQLFSDVKYPATAVVWEAVSTLNKLTAPMVTTHCIYGMGVPTEISYHYPDGFDKDPEINTSDLGDGTVPLDSLRICEKWNATQPQPIDVTAYDLIDHSDIIKDKNVIHKVLSITTR